MRVQVREVGTRDIRAQIVTKDTAEVTGLCMEVSRCFVLAGVSWDTETGVATLNFVPGDGSLNVISKLTGGDL